MSNKFNSPLDQQNAGPSSSQPCPKKPKFDAGSLSTIQNKRPNPLLDAAFIESKKPKLDLILDSEVWPFSSGMKYNIHGDAFQVKLLMLCAHRARKKKLFPFKLATEMDAADKNDDVVFQYKNPNEKNGKIWRFMQAKHILEPEKNKISISELKSSDDKNFSLQKYFISFCKITDNEIFKGDLKDFVIITNADFKEETKEWFQELNDLESDEILGFDNIGAEKYKLSLNATDKAMLKNIFKTKLLESVSNVKGTKAIESIRSKLTRNLALVKNAQFDGLQNLTDMEKQFLDNEKEELRELKIRILGLDDLNLIKHETTKELLKTRLPKSFTIPKNSNLIKVKMDLEKRLEEYISEMSIIQVALDNEKFENYLKDFLNKFYFITNYMSESTLEQRIDEEIREEFKLKQVDFLGARFEKGMFDFLKIYINGKALFCTSDDVDQFFKYLEGLLCLQMTTGLKTGKVNELENHKIGFNKSSIPDSLYEFISNGERGNILHFSTQTVRLSAIKVLQTINNYAQFKEYIDSYLFISLQKLLYGGMETDLKYENTRQMILNAFEMINTCNLLVIECQKKENSESNNLDKLCNEISRILQNQNPSKKIVLISHDDDKLLQTIRDDARFNGKIEKFSDETSFSDYDDNSKDRIRKRNVVLQNPEHPVQLNLLIDTNSEWKIFDQHILSRFLDETQISIGDQNAFSSRDYDKDYYIERKFHHQIIEEKILIKEKSELFFITGINKEDLMKMIGESGNILEYEEGENYEKGIIIPSQSNQSQDCKEIFESLGVNANWLHYCSSQFIWKGCKSNAEVPNKYVSKNKKKYSDDVTPLNEDFCRKAEENFLQKIIIVANDSGMGKSTVLTSLARKMKMLDDYQGDVSDDRWIVRINLNDHTQKLLQIDENQFDITNAIEFVTEIAVPGDRIKDPIIRFQQNIFEAGLTGIENKKPKIVIMFDGFDEISPRHKDKTTRLIKTLKASQVAQIWVTTRVHEKVHLEQELEAPAFILNHLSEDDQIKFFSQFWKWNFKFEKDSNGKKCDKTYEDILKYLSEIELPCDDYAKQFNESISEIRNDFPQGLNNLDGLRNAIDNLDLSKYIQELKRQWEKSLEIGGMQFTVNPLHCKMLAELILRNRFRLPEEFGLFHMYDQFREMKFDIYYEEKTKYSKDQNEVIENLTRGDKKLSNKLHKALAVQLFFYDESENGLLPDLEELSRFEGDEQETEKQEAVRRGFLRLNNDRLEFIHRSFAEYFLSIYLIDNLNNEQVQRLLVSEILVEYGFRLIVQFFNDQLSDENNIERTKKIKLKGSAKKLLEEGIQEEESDDFILYKIATGNHIGIIKFLFNAIPSDDDLYETLLTTLFDSENLECFCGMYITKFTIEELLDASSKLDPEMIKSKILHFHDRYENLLSSTITGRNFDSSYNHVEVIIKFILKNENKLGNTFLEQFVTSYPVKEAIKCELKLAQDFEIVQKIINSFKDHLPKDIFHKFQAFLVDSELIDLFQFDEKCTEWLFEWFRDTPNALNSLLIKYVLKMLEDNFFQHNATDSVEIIFECINDSDISKDLAMLFVYSNSSPEEDIERLLNAVEHSSKFHTILTSFQTKLHEIRQIQGDLSEKIRIGNENGIREILEQLNVLQVAAKFNQIGIVEKFLENIKDFPMILEEEINKVDGSGETALLIAARLGHDTFVRKLLKSIKDRLAKTVLMNVVDKFKNALSNNRFEEIMKKKDTSSEENTSSEEDTSEQKKDVNDKTNRLNEAIRVGTTGKVQGIINKSTNSLEKILLKRNEDGKTALHVAAEHNQFEVVQMLFDSIEEQPKIVEQMALRINKFNKETALRSAARLGHKQTVEKILDLMKDYQYALKKLLLESSENHVFLISDIRLGGINHIFSWIKRNLGNFHLIKLVVEAYSSDWASLFDIVKKYVDVFNKSRRYNQFLRRYFHHINDPDIFEDLAIFSVCNDYAWHDPKKRVAALLKIDGIETELRQKLSEIDLKFDEINTIKNALDKVVCEGNIDEVRNVLPESLIVLKATLLSRNEKGKTALHLAAENNQSETIEILLGKVKEYPQFLERLLLEADSFQEDTALHRAAQLGHHKAVRSLLKFLENLKNERLSMKIVSKLNGNDENALEVAYHREHHQTVKVIFEFIDDHSSRMFIDQMENIDNEQPIWEWTKENGYAELKQRFLKRIGPREEMKFKLFEAVHDDAHTCDSSAILIFLNDNKEYLTFMKLLFECNKQGETLAEVLLGYTAYEVLDWITSHYKHDTKFLTKFILDIRDYGPNISDFLSWLIDDIEKIIPGIIKRVFFKSKFPMSYELNKAIESNDFYEAKKFLKLSKKNCSEEIFEKLVLDTRGCPNRTILEFIDMSKNPLSSEITDFFKFLFELLENHLNKLNILNKLLLRSDILDNIKKKCTEHPDTHEIHTLFNMLKPKYDEFAQSLLNSNPIVSDFSSKELKILQKHVEYFYDGGNKNDILQKLKEIRSNI